MGQGLKIYKILIWQCLPRKDNIFLIIQILCCHDTNLTKSRLENYLSYTYKSIWATKGLLQAGMSWKVGTGDDILI
ncbi:hypothetical protein EPI10_023470 [Gossypium australe]|uniref:Uncharacterized protein n=1 Tax=Gossypium australe TaxID=47621 RepID=A0A5B6VV53_9ROSI|nr:hypothetical protein EPI10_023470 [Gossypium australe]